MFGKVSKNFKRRWSSILREAERKLLLCLKNEALRMQECRNASHFYAKSKELTRTRGDELVCCWLKTLKRCEKTWTNQLADRRKRKFKLWFGKGCSRRRRALSPGAIRDLRTLVSRNELYNDGLGSGRENLEVDQTECTKVNCLCSAQPSRN